MRNLRRLKLVEFTDYFKLRICPPISVIAPAYNEELTIIESVRSLLALHYPEYELIVVNDGSKDNTLQKLIDNFELLESFSAIRLQLPHQPIQRVFRSRQYRNLLVVDKANGGKADALNTGINCSRYNHFASIDADSILDKDSLLRTIRPFMEKPDKMMAVGGIVRIANGCTIKNGEVLKVELPSNIYAKFQIVEYFRAFLAGRVGFSVINGLLIISGAFGVFRKDIAIAAGGYDSKTVGEDMDLVVKIHKHCRYNSIPYLIEFTPDPVCWTEAPESAKILSRQRSRWQRGTIEVLIKHIDMLFNPKYGIIGMFSFPFFFFFEMLGVVVELFGYLYAVFGYIFGILNLNFMIQFLFFAYLYGVLLSILSILIEELSFKKYPNFFDVITICFYALIENLWYRQMTLVWRVRGVKDYFMKVHSWGEMTRKGFNGQKGK